MFNLEILITFIADLTRTLLSELVSDRVRKLRFRPRLRGMKEVSRHVHRATSRRLLNRISTETRR
jgi:hypothetical protein